MANEIQNKVFEILKENVELGDFEIEKLSLESHIDTLGLNSVTFIKLIVGLEKEFDVEFEDSFLDYGKFTTIKSIVDLIEEKLNMSE